MWPVQEGLTEKDANPLRSTNSNKNRNALLAGILNDYARVHCAECAKSHSGTGIVDGVEALYFQSPTPRPGVMWRQWALVKNGHAFVIVSTLPVDDPKLLADVESMIKSFRVDS